MLLHVGEQRVERRDVAMDVVSDRRVRAQAADRARRARPPAAARAASSSRTRPISSKRGVAAKASERVLVRREQRANRIDLGHRARVSLVPVHAASVDAEANRAVRLEPTRDMMRALLFDER